MTQIPQEIWGKTYGRHKSLNNTRGVIWADIDEMTRDGCGTNDSTPYVMPKV